MNYSSADNFLDIEPGTSCEYSNIAAALAGYNIESVSGTSLVGYAATHIFTPLEMSNTSWRCSDLDQGSVVTLLEAAKVLGDI